MTLLAKGGSDYVLAINSTITTGSSLKQPHDRNPTNPFIGYNVANVAPHVDVSRASYTVPANRKCILNAIHLSVTRSVVATVLAKSYISIAIGAVFPAILAHWNNTVGFQEKSTFGINQSLIAGAFVDLHTANNDTGGTLDYYATVMLTEFDA